MTTTANKAEVTAVISVEKEQETRPTSSKHTKLEKFIL